MTSWRVAYANQIGREVEATRRARCPISSEVGDSFRCGSNAVHGVDRSWGGGAQLIVSSTGSTTSLNLNAGAPFHTTDNTVENARAIEVPNSTVVANVWDEVTAAGERRHFYALSPDGEKIVRVRKTTFDLKLRHGHFDPIDDGPRPVEPSLTAGAECNLYIVQFVTQTLQVYRDALTALGAKVYNFLPRHSHIVKMTPTVKAQVEAMAFVRAVVPFHPAYRVSDGVRAQLAAEYSSSTTEKYAVTVFERGLTQQNAVADQISALGGSVPSTTQAGYSLKATLTLDHIRTLITMDEVQFVNVTGDPSPAMDVARKISGADYLAGLPPPEIPFTGVGVRGEVMDDGVRRNHVAFNHPTTAYPIVRCDRPPSYTEHGTKVYGAIFGDGSGSPSSGAKGILPDGEGLFFSREHLGHPDPNCGDRHPATSRLVGAACCPPGNSDCPYQAVFQSNSWGASSTPYSLVYSDESLILDHIAFTYDILVCQAQGNCGNPSGHPACDPLMPPQQSLGEAWAKNVVSVGGLQHWNHDASCREHHQWSFGETCSPSSSPECQIQGVECPVGWASHGPAADLRIKPDLVHFYDNILTACNQGNNCYTDGESPNPPPFTGTSAATPITCGYAGLIFEMWASDSDGDGVNMFGNALADRFCDSQVDNCVFVNRPHASTVKALMITTAYRYPMGQTDINRSRQGWGMVDVETLYDERTKIFGIDETYLLQNFPMNSMDFDVTVEPGEPSLSITLTYADPPGTLVSTRDAINDLSLKVTSPSGATLWGNCGLYSDNWTSPDCTTENQIIAGDPTVVINTVENVFLQNPEVGTWNILVSADEINTDGHVRYLNDDPSECCRCPLPPLPCDPACTVSSPTDVDFALVVSGVSAVYGACCDPKGRGCADTTRDGCVQLHGEFLVGSTCSGGPQACPMIE